MPSPKTVIMFTGVPRRRDGIPLLEFSHLIERALWVHWRQDAPRRAHITAQFGRPRKRASAMTLKIISFLLMTCLAVWIAPYVYALYAVVEWRTF